ncbi:MAG: hypothetical protein QNK33_07085 [Bacteroidales bacterium]|nr:hypothetical protein [Bacteroidales bacterium]
MITNLVILAFIIGLLTVLIIIGAVVWFEDLKLKMSWWKWTLSALWYILLLFFILASFTFMGEGEISAGWKSLAAEAVIMVVLGVALIRILLAGRDKS